MAMLDDFSSPCCLNRTGPKTRLVCILSPVILHVLRGSLNISEDHNEIYNYPNLGSVAFILAAALYTMSLCLHIKDLCIRNERAQCLYKVIVVLIISNFLLEMVWQALINLTVEAILVIHDILVYVHLPSRFLLEYMVSYYLGHVEALLILGWVLKSLYWTSGEDGSSDRSMSASMSTQYSESTDESWGSYFYDKSN